MCQVFCAQTCRCFHVVLLIHRWLCSCLGNVVASASWCTLLYLPSALIGEALQFSDDDVRRCFSKCTAIDTPNVAWQQAQLSLSRGCLGLRSLSEHSSAAYISSLSASGVCSSSCKHLAESIKDLNELVSSDDALVLDHLDVVMYMYQRSLSAKLKIMI